MLVKPNYAQKLFIVFKMAYFLREISIFQISSKKSFIASTTRQKFICDLTNHLSSFFSSLITYLPKGSYYFKTKIKLSFSFEILFFPIDVLSPRSFVWPPDSNLFIKLLPWVLKLFRL